MAIRDQGQKYYLKTGEILEANTADTNYLWVGGSPIGVNSASTYVTGDMTYEGLWVKGAASGITYIGVAYRPFADIESNNPLVTWVTAPSILIIELGEDDEGDDDPVRPWDISQTYNVGDLLRPINYTHPTTGVIYSVWTNYRWTNENASDVVSYYAVILRVYGTSAAPTALMIQLVNTLKDTEESTG